MSDKIQASINLKMVGKCRHGFWMRVKGIDARLHSAR
jgi:hypothetical protein